MILYDNIWYSVNTPFLDMLQEDLPSESLPFEYAIEKKHEYELGP